MVEVEVEAKAEGYLGGITVLERKERQREEKGRADGGVSEEQGKEEGGERRAVSREVAVARG